MFAKIALFVASAFALGAMAGGVSQCNVGEVHCCNSVQEASSPTVQGLLGLVGAAVGSITGQVGVACVPVSVIGASGNSCSAQPTCCTGNNFNGLVVVGCSPINANL